MHAVVDALNAHRSDAYEALYAEDFSYELPGFPAIKDRALLGPTAKMLDAAFPDGRLVADYIVADDSNAVFVGRYTGTHNGPFLTLSGAMLPPTGRRFDIWFVMALECENGKIVRHQDFLDRTEWLRQLSSSDSTPSK